MRIEYPASIECCSPDELCEVCNRLANNVFKTSLDEIKEYWRVYCKDQDDTMFLYISPSESFCIERSWIYNHLDEPAMQRVLKANQYTYEDIVCNSPMNTDEIFDLFQNTLEV